MVISKGVLYSIMQDPIAMSSSISFRLIYYQYHEKLYSYIFNKTSSCYMAEEVVQLTFIRFWENRETTPSTISDNIQLFRIARTILIDLLRKESVRNNHLNFVAETIPQFSEENVLPHKDMLVHIHKAIELFPPMRKSIFKLSRENGLSYKEIAEIYSISEKTVENHIAIALKQLKKIAGFLAILLHLPS